MKTKMIVACLICLGLVLPACGKKGAPIPQDQKNRFAWKTEDAQFIGNGCLAVTASMTGAVHNVDSFLLELEPLTPQTPICRRNSLSRPTLARGAPSLPANQAK